ncbi:MAG: lactate racemase domain-containing protein [Candidatus Methylomirabilales bacterium]
MTLPRMTPIQMRRRGPALAHAPLATRRALRELALSERVRPGQRVAITGGSRGIAKIATITKTVVASLRELKAEPFIIPAMGSHGRGAAEGQREVLQMYGISEETMGAPILASMEVIELGLTPEGIPVYLDKLASEADWILLVNRVKPHTSFAGRIGSGLLKMTAFGLGKHRGALACHEAVMQYGYERVIHAVSAVVLSRARILGGLAILENSEGDLAKVVALPVETIVTGEERLFQQARRWAPRLPFDELDLLIVDEMGKDIAGTGMDTNVIGRRFSLIEKPPPRPRIVRIFVRGLTPETHGNATGVGLADFTMERLLQEMDREATYTNSLTARTPEHSRLPMAFASDREVLEAALKTLRVTDPLSTRIVRIKNTLQLKTMLVSEILLPEARRCRDLVFLSEPQEITFDPDGNLPPWQIANNRPS